MLALGSDSDHALEYSWAFFECIVMPVGTTLMLFVEK